MDWKKEARYQLEHYNEICAAVKAIPEEIRQLEIQASSLRRAMVDRPRVSGGGGSREDALLESIMFRDELQLNLDMAKLRVKRIDTALSALDDENRQLLEILFINKKKGAVERACELLYCDVATVYRKKDKALRCFTLLMYGSIET